MAVEVEETPEAEIDMTPMIDVVFLLIIFFMVVSDMSKLDIAQLTLPFADQASEPQPIDPIENPSLCINVQSQGQVLISGTRYAIKPEDADEGRVTMLKDFLKIEAEASSREQAPPDNPGLRPSKLRILIRADRETRFKNVQGVFDACQKNGIYKTVLGASKENRPGSSSS